MFKLKCSACWQIRLYSIPPTDNRYSFSCRALASSLFMFALVYAQHILPPIHRKFSSVTSLIVCLCSQFPSAHFVRLPRVYTIISCFNHRCDIFSTYCVVRSIPGAVCYSLIQLSMRFNVGHRSCVWAPVTPRCCSSLWLFLFPELNVLVRILCFSLNP